MPLVGMLLGALGLLAIGLFGLQERIQALRLRERARVREAARVQAQVLRERALRPEFWASESSALRFRLSPKGTLQLHPFPSPPSPGQAFGAQAGHPILRAWFRAQTPSALAQLEAMGEAEGDSHAWPGLGLDNPPSLGSQALRTWVWARVKWKLGKTGGLKERLRTYWEQIPPEGWEGPFLRLFLDLGWEAPSWGLDWLAGRPVEEILALEAGPWEGMVKEAFLRARGRRARLEIPELGLRQRKLPQVFPLRGGQDLLFAFKREGGVQGLLLPTAAALRALEHGRPKQGMGVLLRGEGGGMREGVEVLPGIVLLPDFPAEELGGSLKLLYLLAGAILVLGIILAARSLAKEKRAFVQREDFLRAATHELKTPLTSLRLLLESLSSGRISEPEKRREYLQLLRGETERLSHLVGQALDFRQVEREAFDVDSRDLALGPFLTEMASLYAPQLERKARCLRLQVQDGLQARADPALLRRILWNLLENARLHGAGRVSLSARADGEWVSLLVEDEGEGLGVEAWERVFEPFARGPGAGEGRVPGMGLGLAFVRRLTQAMGGNCRILPSDQGFCIQVCLLKSTPSSSGPRTIQDKENQ